MAKKLDILGIYKEITPDDNNDLDKFTYQSLDYYYCRMVHVQGAGNLNYVGVDGETREVPLTTGLHLISARRIMSTNTTCTGISVVY